MTLTETTIKVPEPMLMYVQPETSHDELTRNAMILYPYIKNGTISHGRAAELLGMKKWNLIELYCDLGFPYFSSVDEFEEDRKTIDMLMEKMG